MCGLENDLRNLTVSAGFTKHVANKSKRTNSKQQVRGKQQTDTNTVKS